MGKRSKKKGAKEKKQAKVAVKAADAHVKLLRAARMSDVRGARDAIAHGASVDIVDSNGWAPLSIAAHEGNEMIMDLLISAGATLDHASNDGCTPLYIAAQHGHEVVLQRLIDAGATLDHATKEGATPLYIAAQNGQEVVLQRLIDAGATVDKAMIDGSTPLCIAVQTGQDAIVERLLREGASANCALHKDGITALMAAAHCGRANYVHLLLDSGADASAVTTAASDALGARAGNSALDIARRQGHDAVVHLLIEAHAAAAQDREEKEMDASEANAHGAPKEADVELHADDDGVQAATAVAVAHRSAHECHQCFRRKTHDGAKIKLWYCTACMHARYCSAACQHTHWHEHKSACKLHAHSAECMNE